MPVYSIPEKVLRSLPSRVPGHSNIEITNCQAAVVGPTDPTPSTFFFRQGKRQTTWQVVDVDIQDSARDGRLFYIAQLEKPAGLFIFQILFRFALVKYLSSLGAKQCEKSLSRFIEMRKQFAL